MRVEEGLCTLEAVGVALVLVGADIGAWAAEGPLPGFDAMADVERRPGVLRAAAIPSLSASVLVLVLSWRWERADVGVGVVAGAFEYRVFADNSDTLLEAEVGSAGV